MPLLVDLNTLESAGLVRLAASQPEVEYLFRHALVQEAAYASILRVDRRQLHLAVGEALERMYADRLEEFHGLLAYHFSRAEAWDMAFQHAWPAGDRAKRLYASAEALAYYDLALKALTHLEEAATNGDERQKLLRQRFDVLSERHGVWTLLGQFERVKADLEEMIALARQAGDDARLSDALNGLGYYYLNTGAAGTAVRSILEEALAVKRRLGDQRGQADSLNTLATIYISQGEVTPGLEASAEAHRLYEALGDVGGLARSEWATGSIMYEAINAYDRAIEHLGRALALSRQVGNRALECGSLMMIGAANVRAGDYAAGRAYLAQTLEMARQIGDHPAEGWVLLYLSWADREERQFETSLTRAQQALTVGREVGSDNLIWYAVCSLARLHLAWDRPEAALSFAAEAHQLGQRHSMWLEIQARSLAALARAHLRLGHLEEARRHAMQALHELQKLGGQGVAEVQGVYLDCYQALRAAKEAGAHAALQHAHAAMTAQAEAFADPARRARFLSAVMVNREIAVAWEASETG